MRLTQHADYALRTLIYLGLKQPELATIGEISEAYNISRNHLMKVVSKLATRGYLLSTRGAGGGIRLSQTPEAINLGQVVRAMEPDDGLVECLRPENQCVITPACVLPGILLRAHKAFMQELDRYSLADLMPADKDADFRQLLSLDQPLKILSEED